ncbi:hypothetical protein V1477_019672 [Vespula maculifrons]|uniref:Uncharacterized protein n=1 Tax=Vespula maculifrons TaxID=7453 RepID=A0ABD2ARQ5_VESMC
MQLPPRGGTWVGRRIIFFVSQQQTRVIDGLCQLLVQFRFEFRRVHIVDFAWSGGDTLPLLKRYKEANFDSRSSLVTNFNESTSQSSQCACSKSKREELIFTIKCSGGDTLPLVKRYKAADFGNGPVLSRISTSPNLSPRSTHAPENRVVWWGYFGTREVIKGDGLCQGVQSCHEFQRVHISILVVHTPRKEGMSPCFRTRMLGKTLTRVTAGTRVGVRGREIKSCRGLRFDFEIELDTTGRVSRCLKPTVWTVERSVSGVLYISSLLRNLKLPKRKGISDRGF